LCLVCLLAGDILRLCDFIRKESYKIANYHINMDFDESRVYLVPAFSVLEEFTRLKAINDESFEGDGKVTCDLCKTRIRQAGIGAHRAWCAARIDGNPRLGKRVLAEDEVKELLRLRNVEKKSLLELTARFGITRYSVYQYLRQAKKPKGRKNEYTAYE